MSPEPQEENRDSGVGESPAVEKPAKPEPTPAEKYPVAQRILVPMANPATAEGLLRLANSLVGDDGKIIAAFVMVQNTEPRAGTLEKLEEIVEKLVEEGASIQLVTDMATSIARGILDLAQEQHADLIVLGIRGKRGSKIVLGQVVDSVARTSPCNVLVYRGMHSVYSGEGYRRVVVPVDGSTNSRVAARIGLRFASYTDAPMSALFVQTESSMRRWQALGHIEASLEDIEDIEHVRRLVVRSNDVVSGIVSRCSADDLIVLGFSEQSSLDSWLFGDIAQRMLAGAPGPLLLVKQAAQPDADAYTGRGSGSYPRGARDGQTKHELFRAGHSVMPDRQSGPVAEQRGGDYRGHADRAADVSSYGFRRRADPGQPEHDAHRAVYDNARYADGAAAGDCGWPADPF